jgi:hypothetical protein
VWPRRETCEPPDEQANSQENYTRPDQRTDRLLHQWQRPSEVKQ